MGTSTDLITYEESLTMPESNLEEVIDRELLTMPPASKHQCDSAQLRKAITQLPEQEYIPQRAGFEQVKAIAASRHQR